MIESKQAKVAGHGAEVTGRRDRQLYQAPALKIYGSVAQFTNGSNTCNSDSSALNNRQNPSSACR